MQRTATKCSARSHRSLTIIIIMRLIILVGLLQLFRISPVQANQSEEGSDLTAAASHSHGHDDHHHDDDDDESDEVDREDDHGLNLMSPQNGNFYESAAAAAAAAAAAEGRTPIDGTPTMKKNENCERITVPHCKDLPYTEAIMPNLMGHTRQEDAAAEINHYSPLLKFRCSPDLKLFLCAMFTPVCTIMPTALPPCRSLCLSARSGCEGVMNKFGYPWPEAFNCEKFPVDGNSDELCVGPAVVSNETTAATHGAAGRPGTITTIDSPPLFPLSADIYGSRVRHPHYPQMYMNGHHGGPERRPGLSSFSVDRALNISRDLGFSCPVQFRIPAEHDYSFRLHGKDHVHCGLPCEGLLFAADQRQLLRLWTGIWSIVCLLSTGFTLTTFLIDSDRFRYPERSIIFLSLCYLVIALVYLIGFLAEDRVACNEPFSPPVDHPNAHMISSIAMGNRKESCTLLFMVLYYFSAAQAVWWVILTLTWFLAAGLKWGHEAIEANCHFFHLFAWAIPAVLTIVLLALGTIEGDTLTGTCSVGLLATPSDALLYLLVIPFAICLLIGIGLFVGGFVSLWQIRAVMGSEGTKTDKLEKFMMRIGFFSVLYICPAIMLLACYYYELSNKDAWLHAWLNRACRVKEYSIPCPVDRTTDRPYQAVFMLKYFATLMAGVTSGFWIWSEKTWNAWSSFNGRFLNCLCGLFSRSNCSAAATTAAGGLPPGGVVTTTYPPPEAASPGGQAQDGGGGLHHPALPEYMNTTPAHFPPAFLAGQGHVHGHPHHGHQVFPQYHHQHHQQPHHYHHPYLPHHQAITKMAPMAAAGGGGGGQRNKGDNEAYV